MFFLARTGCKGCPHCADEVLMRAERNAAEAIAFLWLSSSSSSRLLPPPPPPPPVLLSSLLLLSRRAIVGSVPVFFFFVVAAFDGGGDLGLDLGWPCVVTGLLPRLLTVSMGLADPQLVAASKLGRAERITLRRAGRGVYEAS